jgi:hypothetical protein
VISEADGIPLAVSLTGGNRNDITRLMPLIAAILPVRGRRGRPGQAGSGLCGRGYDDIHEAFLSLACAIICWRRLRNLSLCEEFLATRPTSGRQPTRSV